jgi:hypothetical protein
MRTDVINTKWIIYSRWGVQSHGFETPNKVNFMTCNLKDETLYSSREEALLNIDSFYDNVCEISSLMKISKFIFPNEK